MMAVRQPNSSQKDNVTHLGFKQFFYLYACMHSIAVYLNADQADIFFIDIKTQFIEIFGENIGNYFEKR